MIPWPEDLAGWLVEHERRYGGRVDDLPERRSPLDPRPPGRGPSGGDRMDDNGYAPHYARFLNEFVARNGRALTVVEIGVARGTGLALWCDLFPEGWVIGLDIRPETFDENLHALLAAGAFRYADPLLMDFDQFDATRYELRDVLLGAWRPQIVIDDGCHVDAATLRTLDGFAPHMADDFLYFVEDSPRGCRIHETLARGRHGWKAHRPHRSLTVMSP